MNKRTILILTIGIIIGMALSAFVYRPYDTKSNGKSDYQLVNAVTENEEVCPVKVGSDFPDSTVTFAPVSLPSDFSAFSTDMIGENFNAPELGKDLYKYSDEENPWEISNIDVEIDLKNEEIYYGKTAMNHTPHVAYVVKDGKIIFFASGANISIKQSVPNGILVSETLDWNIGEYKTIKYKYEDGKFIPLWYQISCKTTT